MKKFIKLGLMYAWYLAVFAFISLIFPALLFSLLSTLGHILFLDNLASFSQFMQRESSWDAISFWATLIAYYICFEKIKQFTSSYSVRFIMNICLGITTFIIGLYISFLASNPIRDSISSFFTDYFPGDILWTFFLWIGIGLFFFGEAILINMYHPTEVSKTKQISELTELLDYKESMLHDIEKKTDDLLELTQRYRLLLSRYSTLTQNLDYELSQVSMSESENLANSIYDISARLSNSRAELEKEKDSLNSQLDKLISPVY